MRAVVVVVVVGRDSRRGLRRAWLGDVDDEGLVDLLPARIVVVQHPAHLLLGPQCPVLAVGGISRDDLERDIGRIEAPAQRVGVLAQYHVPHVVDQIVFPYLHQRGRGIGPLDPYLAVQHGRAEVCRGPAKIVGRGRRTRFCGRLVNGGLEQVRDYLRIRGCNEGLAARDGWCGPRRDGLQ